jgi:hypothetical protein
MSWGKSDYDAVKMLQARRRVNHRVMHPMR